MNPDIETFIVEHGENLNVLGGEDGDTYRVVVVIRYTNSEDSRQVGHIECVWGQLIWLP